MVGRSYARALFSIAQERRQADAVGRELDRLVDLFAREAELREVFARPWVGAATKRALAAEVARRLELQELTRDFLALVAARGRAGHLGAMAAAYHELEDAAAGRVRATVRTAVPLAEAERSALARRLRGVAGGREVALEAVVDRSLLGGFVAEIGSQIVDGSLDGQLARMRERLARG